MGGRLLRRWLEQPLLNIHDIEQRLGAVADLKVQFMIRQELRELLHGLYDLERLAGKIALASVNARDLLALAHTLGKLPLLMQTIQPLRDAWLLELAGQIDPLPELCRLLTDALAEEPIGLKEGNLIQEGYHRNWICFDRRPVMAKTESWNWRRPSVNEPASKV